MVPSLETARVRRTSKWKLTERTGKWQDWLMNVVCLAAWRAHHGPHSSTWDRLFVWDLLLFNIGKLKHQAPFFCRLLKRLYLYLFIYLHFLRGQESAGIVTSEGKCSKYFNVKKGMGMISNIFNDEAVRKLEGNALICKYNCLETTYIEFWENV